MEPVTEVEKRLSRRLEEISVEDIDVGLRFRKDYGDLRDLANDFRERGVITPIAVLDKRYASEDALANATDPNKPYLLLAGGRRTYAAKAAELETIPANIFEHEVDELELRIVELHENVKRKSMTTAEEVEAKKQIHTLMVAKYGEKQRGVTRGEDVGKGWGIEDTAKMLGETKGNTSQDLKLAAAMEEFPELRKAKNKHQAQKQLSNIMKDKARAELARRAQEREAETPLDVARKNLCARYRCGDFFEQSEMIPDRSVDFFEIDPPFAKDLINLIGEDRHTARHYIEVEEEDDKPLVETYHEFLSKTFEIAYRKMKDHAWGICWYAMDPWHEYVKNWLKEAGFTVRGVPNIWDKTNFGGKTNNANYNLAACYENYFYFRKGTPKLAKPGHRNVHRMPPPSQAQRTHPAERPIELYEEILDLFLAGQGKIIVSPFGGSGNIMLAAENKKHNSVAWDLSPQYKADFNFKVMNGKPGEYKTFV